MSKINAVRLINLNYNNNAIKISDETFHFNGESTLLSLRNGGGKSVLVQMIMAPFVHMRYRDAKDRPFESYFTTAKPTFILVEWVLDQNAGYALTGLMVRKRQEFSDDEREHQDELEIISIISEYKDRCGYDIHHLPVLEKTKKELVLKGFGACRQLFETYKKESAVQFFYYDMNNSAQSRQYFDKLKEYQVDYKEWESIIKKVNVKESGLSDLFSDCKDEKGLVEKWFLDAIENKLNKEQNRMKEFQTIVGQYVGQYLENRSKIKRYDTIRQFEEEANKIREEAEKYEASSKQVSGHENLIACFICELERLMELEGQKKEDIQKEQEDIRQKIAYLMYEKLSGEFYQMKEEEEYRSSNLELLDMEREALKTERERTQYGLHLLDCARQQEMVDEDCLSLAEAKQNLMVSQQQETDLEPERKRIGRILKRHYKEACDIWKEKQQCSEALQKKTDQEIEVGGKRLEELASELFSEAVKMEGLRAQIDTFHQTEHAFNHKYGEKFSRNILGEYEPAALDIWREDFAKKLEQQIRERISKKKRMEAAGEEKKSLIRAAEEYRQKCFAAELKKKDGILTRDLYEQELEERKTIIRYFDMEENELFSADKILSSADRKLQEMERVRRNLEKEEDLLQKEITRLTDGKVLELPEVFTEMLESIGIQPIYGMEWLKKNGYTKKQNNRFVTNYPFLPYALIFSKQELVRLTDYLEKEADGGVYTSFPIPIILREQLGQDTVNKEGTIIDVQGIQFYICFNKDLLDMGKLEMMIHEKRRHLEKLLESIDRKKAEQDDYMAKREKIKNQQVTGERYEENQKFITKADQELWELTAAVREKEEGLLGLEKELDDLRSHIMKLERSVDTSQLCLDEFQEYCKAYEVYLNRRKEYSHHQKTAERLEEQKRLLNESMNQLQSERKSLEYAGHDILEQWKRVQDKYAVYADFAEEGAEKQIEKEMPLEELEARYLAITAQFSVERQDLEKKMEQCKKRFDQSKEHLVYLAAKYKLSEEEWKEISYNRKEEQHQEILLEDANLKIQRKDNQWNEEDKSLAVIRQQILSQRKKILLECEKEEPLPKAQIGTGNYEAEMKILSVQEAEMKKREAESCERISGYEGNLTALAEYAYLMIHEPIEWKQNFESMKRKELDAFKGERIRDYRISIDKRQERRNQLSQLLNKILRMEMFQEDFYHKPLEALTELLEDASQVLAQLDITVQSYQSLMEKLQVDISIIGKEKEKIVELLEDYVREVHENLDHMDRNSTITVRERPVKMLKIQLPSWEENEALYQVRLSDFMDEVTKRGVEIFEKNENAADFFAARVTTKNLYDVVVGFSNVQIRLYKIEEQREYPITWTDVAKNSGGEGFLSAFVILSCLLHYMRKDESDIFADRNEGKVLVMDNPFAQTNAAHLLKPLMDMAKKANTQLICLSGLGGESIYSRFDNIYVLNLIAASLRSGMQYLRTDHIKGAEAETMISSRIEVSEQQDLMLF